MSNFNKTKAAIFPKSTQPHWDFIFSILINAY